MPVLTRGRSLPPATALVAALGAGIGLPLRATAHVPDAAAATHAAAWPLPWAFEPWVVACLLASGLGYAVGVLRLWQGAGRGRGIRPLQVAAFAGGWLALAVALVSPLDPLGGRLFSAHMLQHELMMVVAAPLLCLAQPLVAWTWALPPALRRRLGRGTRQPAWAAAWAFVTAPLPAWGLHALVLWGWHLPALFDRALADNGLHVLQHLSFLFSALLFWWSALRPGRAAQRGAALLSVFTTMLHTAALGALLALSDTPWYGAYLGSTASLGVDALQDQQLGGLVMWVPAGVAYLAAGLALVARWLRGTPRLQTGG